MPIGYLVNNGDLSNPIVSQSALNQLDPNMGGHPKKFANYIMQFEPIKKTPSLERGDLLHSWIEHPDDFVFSEVNKPAEKLADFSESFYKLYCNKLYEITEEFAEFCQGDMQLEAEDYFIVNDLFKDLNKRSPEKDEVKLLVYSIFYARKQAEYDKRLVPSTVIKKFKECLPYIKFLVSATGKIAVTGETKKILINCYESLRQHPTAKMMLFDNLLNTTRRKELELFWDERTEVEENLYIDIKRKAKLDNILKTENTIIISDLKTTSHNVGDFKEGAFKEWNLGRQLISYGVGYNAVTQNQKQIIYRNIVVETKEPYTTAIYQMSFDSILSAKRSYNEIMKRLAHHIYFQNWNLTKEEYNVGYIEL